jgi:cellobiose phosphorylase
VQPGKATQLSRNRWWQRVWPGARPLQAAGETEPPLRAELFSGEQMEQHGRALAERHQPLFGTAPDRLRARLARNQTVLLETCTLLSGALKADRRITPAGDWLLDNHYLIEEQIRTARRHFPKRYSWQLPRLASGPSAQDPRVYDIALEAIAHGDGRIDQDGLARFIAAYQEVTPLTLGELWAIPIMLRLALIENLRRVAVRVANDLMRRNLAANWADQMVETSRADPKSLIVVVADMARSNPPVESAFVAEIVRRLQGHGAALALPLTWIQQRLAESGLTIEQLVQTENQQQAADQVSISNSIGSLRLLSVTDWRDFVEGVSLVEATLREDPAGVYARMDFATRDHYRHVVERIARKSPRDEIAIAAAAVMLARRGMIECGNDARVAHVGHYLIDRGLFRLQREVGMRVAVEEQPRRLPGDFPVTLYLGAMAVATAAVGAALTVWAHAGGAHGWVSWLIGVCAVLGASQPCVALVNRLAILMATPRLLPRMDFEHGIPADARAVVAVPCMLTRADGVDRLLEDLEIRFLANQDEQLRYVLLTDLADAASETLPTDAALIERAAAGIGRLNAEYAEPGADRFFLLHRPRRWNAGEGAWIGRERKRGKLADLNALLRGDAVGRFARLVGDTAELADVRYVITLDADTELPREVARKLVATLAHPLNRAEYDDARGRVTRGYGILQPRVGARVMEAGNSPYLALFGAEAGIDPYTRAVSDVYQDLFAEGSFIGKGIYEVDMFERVLEHRFPDNRILSHDLLEGCYARSGLLSDVEVFENSPTRYRDDARRRHRWIRGDWQLASWLLPWVPDAEGNRVRNPLGALSRWKILDNLRRSLVAPAWFGLLLIGWAALDVPWRWTGLVVALWLAPLLLDALLDLLAFRARAGHSPWRELRAAQQANGRRIAQLAFTVACLPYETCLGLDAILRTLWRLHVSHRHLLEWTPSASIATTDGGDRGATWRAMWSAPALAVAAAVLLGVASLAALPAALPFLVAWFVSPALAWRISQPPPPPRTRLTSAETLFVRRLARRTWGFFERFVGAEDHWLPPDNVQEQPTASIAHRTSPTNIGLALLANLAALDFGYLSAAGVIERTARTFASLRELERYRGHFFNWYDTRSLQPLAPMYISTVDSGNLAGHLLTLRQGLLSLVDAPVLHPRVLDGLADTLAVCAETAGTRGVEAQERLLVHLENARESPVSTVAVAHAALTHLDQAAAELVAAFDDEPDGAVAEWAGAFQRQCREALAELSLLAPWCELEVPPDWREALEGVPLPRLGEVAREELPWLDALRAGDGHDEAGQAWLDAVAEAAARAGRAARERIATIERLAFDAGDFAQVDYAFLYDRQRHLFSIGYNFAERRCDAGYYDLLASEARLCVFVAIAQGQVPQESWFVLGRLLTAVGGEPTLLSWSGSMFEYLMPALVMPTFPGTLLDSTCRAAVRRQIAWGQQHDMPWGVSESGYNLVDAALNYQYRAFGVPELGLKRGLADDLVVAPYATLLALPIAPEAACANLLRLAAADALGRYGFHEAIDYTPGRLPRGQSSVVVRSFMAHHQGMGLLALVQALREKPMQRRFEADPLLQSAMLLLQERVPRAAATFTHHPEITDFERVGDAREMSMRVLHRPDTPVPAVQLLSNGRYHVMVTAAGGGYSRWRNLAVTRWREDATRDHWGLFCYLRDLDSGVVWSTMFQPTRTATETYEATFSEPRVEFRRVGSHFEIHTEIVVSPEDDIELRRTRITNRSRVRRTIEVTSYAEVVLADPVSDALHPAFGNLFVETEILAAREAILCTRRPRSLEEHPPWMFHLLAVRDGSASAASFETDRARFLGRGNDVSDPAAMRRPGPLPGSEGSVLDPIVAIRRRIVLEPEQVVSIDLVLGVADTRVQCIALAEKYHDWRLAGRVFDLAWTHSQVALRQVDVSESDAQLYGRLAGNVLYANAMLRAAPELVSRNRRGQSGLWGYAISGDLPIVLVQIRDPARIDLVRQLVQAHTYWRLKGLAVDLVIWNEDRGGYRQELHDRIMGLIAAGVDGNLIDRPGGIFVRAAEQIPIEDRILLASVARAILSDTRGTLAEQIKRREPVEPPLPRLVPTRLSTEAPPPARAPARTLILANGIGGFDPEGHEYVITLAEGEATPAPWSNVLANPDFGCVLSESGSSYTWASNAHEYRLTPWCNDPVSDACGEAVYLRDEETGAFWSPTPLPARGRGDYVCRHGFGYSVFEHREEGIVSSLRVHVDPGEPVKFLVLRIDNASGRPRRLSATGYVEWVLGDLAYKSAMHVITQLDPASGALFARNRYNPEFSDLVAFLDVDEINRTLSGDRAEFIGRNGSLAAPAAMGRASLSGKVGAVLDPCGAIQVPFDLADGESRTLIFRLGIGHGTEGASERVLRLRRSGTARASFETVQRYWQRCLGTIQVDTPDPALDLLCNGWLAYQVIACRLWGRSGYYQSGGAFGFRDQLQDVMALVHAEPALVRRQLLLHASRQFREGDVQHWWHPPSGRGVRTRCSDDYLWLPYATCRYVEATGDAGVLAEKTAFLEGRALNPGEESYYDLPVRSDEQASLYQHCVRAIEHGLRLGVHGLPLIGSGDWNDGMNRVGIEGRGESVWLGFFLHDVLVRFAALALDRHDADVAERCEGAAAALREAVEREAWDGAWYKRAWFDDGTPLGSADNAECRIDSIAQSWAVLSGVGSAQRIETALDSLDEHLVRADAGLIQLLEPPFDTAPLDPGYIRGYAPGVRENGGQYTHAAIWAAMAFAAAGRTERAWDLFRMINPLRHAATPAARDVYKVEPYVVAADVYAIAPHTGRGGWTWYTGSAGWMYRLIVESLLGVERQGDTLRLRPQVPADWPGFTLRYRFGETLYSVVVKRVSADTTAPGMSLDGVAQAGDSVPLVDDGHPHAIDVRVPA